MSDKPPENHYHDSSEDPSVVVNDNVEPPSNEDTNSEADAFSANGKTEATTTADCDSTINNNCSDSSLGKCLSSLISSVIGDFDSRAEQTLRSQDQLSFTLDRLTRELDRLLEDAPLPFIMQQAAKISGVRKRVSSLNTVLKSIQRRVDNIDQMLSAGLRHDKVAREDGGHH